MFCSMGFFFNLIVKMAPLKCPVCVIIYGKCLTILAGVNYNQYEQIFLFI
jgi:hypothetical protein